MIASIFSSPRRVLAGLFVVGFVAFAACAPVEEGKSLTTPDKQTDKLEDPKAYNMFPSGTVGKKPDYPKASHLLQCEQDSDCFGGTRCINLFGEGGLCFYKCDPKKGTGETQNSDCIEPENCIELSSSGGEVAGICVSLPGQLYGIGSYKAFVRHKQGAKCLLHYGGCESGFICVDTSGRGSVGTCEEQCTPPALDSSKNQPKCATAGTTCKKLANGDGACLK
jgi:hypothetical protein